MQLFLISARRRDLEIPNIEMLFFTSFYNMMLHLLTRSYFGIIAKFRFSN